MATKGGSRGKTPASSLALTVKGISVRIPEGDMHYVQLTDDLEKMGCTGLLDKP